MKNRLKRPLAFLLSVVMSLTMSGMPVYAEMDNQLLETGLCEHHKVHTQECGYTQAKEGISCGHEHTEECYVMIQNCLHQHDESCYPAGVSGTSENTAMPSESDKALPTECTHVCSEESGCMTKRLDCKHKHDENCGYMEKVEETPCTYVCAICHPQGSEEADKELEIKNSAQEQCVCTILCKENHINADCPICSSDGAELSACLGKKADDPQLITAWSWVEDEEYEGLIDSQNILPLIGVSKENPVDLETVLSVLPKKITVQTEKGEECLPLAGWQCEDFPKGEVSQGRFLFTASLPEGYGLAESVPALSLTVGLGGGMLMATNDTIEISTLEKDKIQIDSDNLSKWNGKTLTGTGSKEQYLLVKGVTLNLTIDNLTIDRTGLNYNYYSAVELADGATLNLTLVGDNTLTGVSGGAGIYVPAGCTLNITQESTGSLTATGGNDYGGAAGIGAKASNYNLAVEGRNEYETIKTGKIIIAGGTVKAQGGTYRWRFSDSSGAAGIGGSYGASGAEIEITGGTVFAKGGVGAAGIGGGHLGSVSSITISGGIVTAEKGIGKDMSGNVRTGCDGAAIGSGYNGAKQMEDMPYFDTITISDGTVTATGNIGYGDSYKNQRPNKGGSVTISGGSVHLSGKVSGNTTHVDQAHIMRDYTLKLLIYGELSASSEEVTGTVTIGTGEHQYENKNVPFTVEEGKAVAQIEVTTLLHEQQPITVVLGSVTYGEKNVNLDAENEVIWGIQPQLQVEKSSGVTYTYNNGFLIFSGKGSATVTMAEGVSTTEHQIQIAENAEVTLTLRNVTMNSGDKKRSTLLVKDGGKLTLVLEGSNAMEADVAFGPVLSALKATLTIQGTGSLKVKNVNQESDKKKSNHFGIWAKKLTINENPTLSVDMSRCGSGVCTDAISIQGGHITSKAGERGQAGIGGVYGKPGTVTITGGTIYAEGGERNENGGGISNRYTNVIITGGNVNMNRLIAKTINGFTQPKNADGTLLYCTKITVGAGESLSKNAQVLELTIKNEGSDYAYGIEHMVTDNSGNLYLWLPGGAVVSKVKTVNGTYTGSCTANTTTTDGSGNIWGTAQATFPIDGAMFYPVEDITLKKISKPGEFDLNSLASVIPSNATHKEIVWSVEGENTANARVDGQKLVVSKVGKFTLKATVAGGKGDGKAFTKTIPIQVGSPVVEPTATNPIAYGKLLSEIVLSDTAWKWAEAATVPTVNNSGYPAYLSVASDITTDYTDVPGYNAQDKTITRTIPVTVKKVTPAISVQATPSSVIAGKTVSVTATVKNPNNESLTDLPAATLYYRIGDRGGEVPFTDSFVIPKDTATGTVITILAVTAADANYEAGIGTTTVSVSACSHEGNKTLQYDETNHWYLCRECGMQFGKAVHSGGAATCTTKAVCSTCHVAYGELGNHNLTKRDALAPTCTTAGNKAYWHCAACNKNFSDANGKTTITDTELVLPALSHDWGNWTSKGNGTHTRTCKRDSNHIETKDCEGGIATCTTKAVCSTCHVAYGELGNHNLTKRDALAPTCTTAGNKAYWHCATCNKNFSDANGKATITETELVLPALSHDWGSWASNGNGTHTRICKRDGNHAETKDCSGGTATCMSPAICTLCGQTYGVKNQENHTGGTEVRNQKEATTTTEGYTGDTYCLGCGKQIAVGATIPKKSSGSGSGSSSGGGSSSGSGSSGTSGGSSSGNSSQNNGSDKTKSDISKTSPAQPDVNDNAAGDQSTLQPEIHSEKDIPDFADISGHWAENNIIFVASRGLLSGTSKTTFSPNTSMTRGMFVTALGRMAGINPDSYKVSKFADVKADAYYTAYINWAVQTGIVDGINDTTFAPDTNITREQMAVIMTNYAKKLGYKLPQPLKAVTFADNAQISSWAREAVRAMQQAGILEGKDGNQFDPQGCATRAEVATVLKRFVEIVIDSQVAKR